MWLPEGPSAELLSALERIRKTQDVVCVAVMPDAHVAEEVCVGTVTATRSRILPAAVGSDIGCGMVALRFDCGADLLADRTRAATMLAGLYERVPQRMRPSASAESLPEELVRSPLSAPRLEALKGRDARLEFGTLGRGNHFLELQRDDEGALWLAVHSGSRAVGPAIRRHHEARAPVDASGISLLEAESDEGRAYLSDASWAARYATLSRARLVEAVVELMSSRFGVAADERSQIICDHNHVRREEHGGESLWVHRKGAVGLSLGQRAMVPGSMGSPSFHVEGRAHPEALCSSAHGAGRAMSRSEARQRIGLRRLEQELSGVWYDHRLSSKLREEAPSAYKEIGAVMRAQRELVKVVRRLEPVLVYKGG